MKVRRAERDREENKVLYRAMEYAGVVGVELADMLVSINLRVEAIEPHVPTQHTFSRDGLQNFICDHQDQLEQLEDQLANLMMMTEDAWGGLASLTSPIVGISGGWSG